MMIDRCAVVGATSVALLLSGCASLSDPIRGAELASPRAAVTPAVGARQPIPPGLSAEREDRPDRFATTTHRLALPAVVAPRVSDSAVNAATAAPFRSEGAEPFSDDRVHVLVEPYLFLPTIKTWIDGSATTIHQSDVIEDLDFGYMGYVDFRYQRWGLFLDTLFMNLEADTNLAPGLSAKAEVDEGMYQMGGFHRFGDEETYLDVLGSARWFTISAKGRLNGITVARARESWWEPVVGLRCKHFFAERWALVVRGDIGGFGIGEASDVTWQFGALIDFKVSDSLFVGAGYRYYFIDYDHGGLDLTQRIQGPMMGFGVSF